MGRKRDISIGIVGTNFVSSWMAEAIAATPGAVCGAVYSRAQETGDAFAAKYGIPAVYTDYDAFLAAPLDAIYVASPNALHYPQTLAALRTGHHVLCEKPIALNREQLSEMQACAHAEKKVLLEAMRPTHDEFLQVLRQYLPQIGTLRHADLCYCQYSSRYDRFRAGEVLNAFCPALGNAALLDIGIYCIHVAVDLFGPPKRVRSSSVFLANGMEGAGSALLTYDGFSATLSYSKIADAVCDSQLLGEDGALSFDKPSAPTRLVLHLRGREPRVVYSRPEGASNMPFEVAAFIDLIQRGAYDHPFLQLSQQASDIVEQIRMQNGICFPQDSIGR